MQERPYQRLVVWQEAYQLCLKVYEYTRNFPDTEKFGLTSQMRRSAYSVPINLAEGNGRKSKKERLQFFSIATASLEELHCECTLSQDLHYLNSEASSDLNSRIQRVGYLLAKFCSSLH